MQTKVPGSPFLKNIVAIYDAAGRVGDAHRDTIYRAFDFILPEIGGYIADAGVTIIACRTIRDVYPETSHEGVLGLYVEKGDDKIVIIPEYVRYGEELHEARDVQNTTLHELGHALAYAFRKDKRFALHDLTEFVRAVERDRRVAAGLSKLAKEHPNYVSADFMDIQLDKKFGYREIFANLVVFIATGIHIEKGMKEFPHALRAVMKILRRENLLHSLPQGIADQIEASTRYQGFADPADRGPQYGDNLKQIPAWHGLKVKEAYVADEQLPLGAMLKSMYRRMARAIERPLSRSAKFAADVPQSEQSQVPDKLRSPYDWPNGQSPRFLRLVS